MTGCLEFLDFFGVGGNTLPGPVVVSTILFVRPFFAEDEPTFDYMMNNWWLKTITN